MYRSLLTALAICATLLCSGSLAAGPATPQPPPPGPKDKCPVCGMFVSKYPAWIASVSFRDGSHAYFDGAKDMFIYLANMTKYTPKKTPAMITAVQVKDYYSLQMVDGKSAFYVIGSNVYGPMGHELVPFAQQADAQGFLQDHKGRQIVRYREVNQTLLKTLE
jgi:nitrous oxide reductase accessory protein NosL